MEKVQRLVRQSLHVLLVILLVLQAFSCDHRYSYVINGKVMDGGNGKVYLFRYGNKDFRLVDSVDYKNGCFIYKGETDQPLLFAISVNPHDRSPQSFFVGEDTLRLSFWKTGGEVVANDSPLNDLYLSMREKAPAATEQAILRYVHDHADSPVTAFFVLHDWSWRLDLPTLKLIYDTLEPSLKNCVYLCRLHDLMDNMRQVQPGKTMPAMKTSVSVKQQTVLVFFASWCPDCRNELPALEKKVAERKDIHFVGFSLDTSKIALKQFEKAHPRLFSEILSDYKGWDSPVAQTFAVRWIPTFFLISKDGVILKVAHKVDELF